MMQRWNKKRTHFPLLVLILLVFIVCSILYIESSIRQIHEDSDHVRHDQEVPISHEKPNLPKSAPKDLDRFSRCNSTRKYSGWRNGWADPGEYSSRRSVSSESCDVFSGKWVFDNTSYPLYNESHCPYMSDQLACHKHGRSDLRYQHWRWQPHNCNLKRWNATEMWEKLRGKRLMFVGDSLNRGQWISMVCLLQSVIPANKRSMTPNAQLTVFRAEVNQNPFLETSVDRYYSKHVDKYPREEKFFNGTCLSRLRLSQWKMWQSLSTLRLVECHSCMVNIETLMVMCVIVLFLSHLQEYNATVEFLWAPLLVESNSDDPVNHRLGERIIRPDSVLKHASKWEQADILVFNTYLWWRQGPVKLLWSTEDNGACEELDGLGAMELAMSAWADWVASKVNPRKKRVFFVTMSPTHLWNREWAPGSEGNCYSENNPIDWAGYWGSGADLPTMRMVDKVLGKLSSKVRVLNITQLSEYRKDGHPSIYRKFWETMSPAQLSNPSSYSDCIHWCLPGVPDVWNELLFHFL
ncbi:hypothetical protein Dsin_007259 [Dipteronia sinensis]|uniref:Trichome birefringence-like N-terminal domain-containing protein n=1 Tax=Dipteronia sinensis TaxID=43782 RepID=A0AAE0B131_9ROSI|nr:hypothetical protein Dsin_007259 [Dipteronia sinensis]